MAKMGTSVSNLGLAATLGVVALSMMAPSAASAQQAASGEVSVSENDLGGVVTSASGAEAGVRVIAETTDLPTKFAKIVVTDDQGRYLMPDLPRANYKVWVRGYGLVDSAKVDTTPGQIVNLTAATAPNETAATQYYPAIYWYAMLKIPGAGEFPGTGPKGNHLPENLKSQAEWVNIIKTTGCMSCHALGTIGTRTISPQLGEFKNSAEAWERRIQSGQAMTNMVTTIGRLDTQRALQLFGDWTDRIAAGGCHSPSRRGRRASSATSC
jgi:hypothetical protein